MRFLLKIFIKKIAFIFYKKEYLSGKYFEKNGIGWGWVLKGIWQQKILRFNRQLPFPASPNIYVSNYKNLVLGRNTLNNFQSFGIYFQNFDAFITLGDDTYIAPNVGIITSNHDPKDLNKHMPGKSVIIGSGCWIGMNSVILPGVILGPNTIVGAGSIVTKSFTQGNLIIAGNPARIIKDNNTL